MTIDGSMFSWKIRERLLRLMKVIALVLLAVVSIQLAVRATATGGQASKPATRAETIKKRWGIQIRGIRLTGADYFLDFRYRVKDPEKASALQRRQEKVYLIDQATGTKLPVPITKVGPLRATGVKPKPNREYVILFSNVNKIIKRGSKVTVVIGNFRAKNLVVE